MKLEKLRLKNFALFENFEIVFNDGVTHLVGMNGDGKTTVGCTGIWAGFKGIAEKSSTGHLIGERFRFITEGKKSLDVEITLYDEKTKRTIVLKRHITKTTNTIKIASSDDSELSREYIEGLFNVSFLSASHFCELTGAQQAAAMGIDTSKFDKDLKAKKEQAQEFRRDIKKIGELTPVKVCEKKNIDALYEKQEEAVEINKQLSVLTATLSTAKDKIEDIKEEIYKAEANFSDIQETHKANIERLEVESCEAYAFVNDFEEIDDPVDLKPIEEEIKGIVKANEEYFKYETYTTKVAEKEELEGFLNDNVLFQKDIEVDRRNYLQSKAFGIKDLKVDENGQLTKDDKYIRTPYFSKGELEILVARIAMNLNPELKVRFIDNFELLDDVNQVKLITHLTKKGFQIITATVGDKIKRDNSVLLRECKIVGGTVDETKGFITKKEAEDEYMVQGEEVIEAVIKPEDSRQKTFDGTTKIADTDDYDYDDAIDADREVVETEEEPTTTNDAGDEF